MNVKDLMIGDWVYKSEVQYLTPNSKPVTGQDFEPIPITPEILEKNGFVKRSERDDKLGKMEYYQFEDYEFVYHYSDDEWMFNLVNENPKRRDFTGYLNYVHELQHVLNILNIEKEIKL